MPNLARLPITASDANTWSDILNRNITQTTSSINGAFNSFDIFSARPANLTTDDAGKTYLYTQTGNWHEWSGIEWKVQNKSEINVKDYGVRGDNSTDDTNAIQAIFDSLLEGSGTYFNSKVGKGKMVFFPHGTYLVTKEIFIKNSNLRIFGEHGGFSGSIIKSSSAGNTFKYDPYVNDVPFLEASSGKLHIENLRFVATDNAKTTGTCFNLHAMITSKWENLIIESFAIGMFCTTCYLNTFSNIFWESTEGQLGVDGAPTPGDLNNNNSFVGGWCRSSMNLSSYGGTTIQNIDFEPQTRTLILGDDTILFNCRIERFDLFGAKVWIKIVGNNCRLYGNKMYWDGSSPILAEGRPAIVLIEGNNNEVEIPEIYSNISVVKFGTSARGNTINYKSSFKDYRNTTDLANYRHERTSVDFNNLNNRVIRYSEDGQRMEHDSFCSVGYGQFKNLIPVTTNIATNNSWQILRCTKSVLAASDSLPAGRTSVDINNFVKYTVTGANPFLAIDIPITETGTYTFGCIAFIPATTNSFFRFGTTNYDGTVYRNKGKWQVLTTRGYYKAGETLTASFGSLGTTGTFIVGEVVVNKGDVAIFGPYNQILSNPKYPLV